MYKIKVKSLLMFFCISAAGAMCNYSLAKAQNSKFEMLIAGDSYQYSVIQAGDNFNFKFENNIPPENVKLRAGYLLLKSIYKDNSINKTYSEHYIRERARCYVFDSSLHTYSMCFLPNEFSSKSDDRLWGFVTQMPNWKWLMSRFFLPVLFAFGLFFYFSRKKHP